MSTLQYALHVMMSQNFYPLIFMYFCCRDQCVNICTLQNFPLIICYCTEVALLPADALWFPLDIHIALWLLTCVQLFCMALSNNTLDVCNSSTIVVTNQAIWSVRCRSNITLTDLLERSVSEVVDQTTDQSDWLQDYRTARKKDAYCNHSSV